MIMKRFIYAALTAMMILSGCEYHPYYDGQSFRVYHKDYGLIETDGTHIYVPVQDDEPCVLELYGGKGKNHTVRIENTDCLGYSYEKSDVRKSGFDDPEIIPAGVTLIPKELGYTSLILTEEDTGESVMIYVHVCEAYKAIDIYESTNSLDRGTVLAFRYGGKDDVVRICKEDAYSGEMKHVVDGRYAFVSVNSTVCLELHFPADRSGQPCADGEEIFRKYIVEFKYGGVYGSANGMMQCLNLLDFPLQTKSSVDYNAVHYDFQFVDITDEESPEADRSEYPVFFAKSAVIIPWIE